LCRTEDITGSDRDSDRDMGRMMGMLLEETDLETTVPLYDTLESSCRERTFNSEFEKVCIVGVR
jgi:hypothetical protein